jgi:hypothetical protein
MIRPSTLQHLPENFASSAQEKAEKITRYLGVN